MPLTLSAQPLYNMVVVQNQEMVEYGKFTRLDNNTLFPYITVIQTEYPDQTQMFFPWNTAYQPTSTVNLFPKFAVLTYNVNGQATQGATQTAGNPPGFTTQQILIANGTASLAYLSAVLISGNVVGLPVAANSVATYNVAVSAIIAYNSLTVTYLG
jgi:hypothetical protein